MCSLARPLVSLPLCNRSPRKGLMERQACFSVLVFWHYFNFTSEGAFSSSPNAAWQLAYSRPRGRAFSAPIPHESGTSAHLLEAEKQQVLQGSTQTSRAKEQEIGQMARVIAPPPQPTITTSFRCIRFEADRITSVVRERVLFSWSKPTSVSEGQS